MTAANRLFIGASALAIALVAGTAGAQDHDLGVIVVTPNRAPAALAETGSSVSVISREEIEEQSMPLVTDYLDLLPGVSTTSPGGPGTETSLSLRGAPRRYAKTLFNGIDISDPTNTQVQTSYQYLLSGGIDSIEVLKGSQSTLYGSEAIAGVISLSTLGDIDPGVSHIIAGEGGSFGTARAGYGLRAATTQSRLSFNATGLHTDGFSAAASGTERDGYENITMDIAGEHEFSDMFSVFGSALFIDAEAEFDDAFSIPPQDDPFHANRNKSRQLAGRAGFNIDLMDGRLKNTFAVQGLALNRDIHTESSFGPYNADYKGERFKAEYQGSLETTEWLTLQYGADYERQNAQFTDDAGSLPINASANNTGFWGQGLLTPVEDLTLTLGLRHDEHSSFGGETTYRASASYLFSATDTRLHASFGTGFRAPSLYELFAPPFYVGGVPIGNPNLQPETSTSFDIGLEQRFLDGRLIADVTYFQLRIDNLIDCIDVVPFECQYIQIPGTSTARGVETSLSYHVNDRLSLAGAYTYTHSVDQTGARLPRVPRHSIGLMASYKPAEKWTISAAGKIAIDTVDTDDAALDDYFLLNAKVAYHPTDQTELYLRVENLLDQDYQTARGFNTPGFSVFAGFKARLGQ
ncbi:TonB-dependent receptor [Chelativorans sp. Marseille-P2723]|uniref:TonB-dependent receptor plug domain-containing protein n=1 Tax=Chelativorans sp. Marseille-P2723 TaxID=2709133 RepID=UPI00156E5DB5|nr:TonB-dependent receptor [Chelativorans sp. Marseille-P2723]